MAQQDSPKIEVVTATHDVGPCDIPLAERPGNAKIQQRDVTEEETHYVTGWKLYCLTGGVWLSLFLSTLETTIVSTSLVSVTNALRGFYQRDWIVTSYLLTYTSFLIIYAKLGDIFGRKSMYLVGLILFTSFSIACGASRSMSEIIVFRAFQGMGASGIYSMTMVVAPTLVPKEKFGKYIAVVSTVFATASILGPMLGGAISSGSSSSWRWIFLINAPAGSIAITLLAIFLPSSSSAHVSSGAQLHLGTKFAWNNLRRVDVVGVTFLLAASILVVFALEEGGSRYSWSNVAIVTSLCVSGICAVLFVLWEHFIGRGRFLVEAVFPLRIITTRLSAAMFLTAFFVGFPFVAIVVNYPQRAQAVADLSPTRAGISLLPLLLTSPVATAASGYLTSTLNVPPVYLIMAGSTLQLIGVGLSCSLPTDVFEVTSKQYGFEAIMGLGFGLVLSTILVLAPLVVSKDDLAVTMGALTQVRVLGGTISLAICSTIVNNHVRPQIASVLTPSQLAAIADSLSAINTLTPEQQKIVRIAFAEGYNKQNLFLTVVSGGSLLTSLFLWETRPRKVKDDQLSAEAERETFES